MFCKIVMLAMVLPIVVENGMCSGVVKTSPPPSHFPAACVYDRMVFLPRDFDLSQMADSYVKVVDLPSQYWSSQIDAMMPRIQFDISTFIATSPSLSAIPAVMIDDEAVDQFCIQVGSLGDGVAEQLQARFSALKSSISSSVAGMNGEQKMKLKKTIDLQRVNLDIARDRVMQELDGQPLDEKTKNDYKKNIQHSFQVSECLEKLMCLIR